MGLLSLLFGGGASKADLPAMIHDGALLIDARSPHEFSGGHIEGAVNIPHHLISEKIAGHETDPSRPIVVYCHSGGRSALAVKALKKAGYQQVENGGAFSMLRRQIEAAS